MSDVARHARRIRETKGLSLEEVARKARIKPMRLWRLETGRTRALATDVPKLARGLGTTIQALYGLQAA